MGRGSGLITQSRRSVTKQKAGVLRAVGTIWFTFHSSEVRGSPGERFQGKPPNPDPEVGGCGGHVFPPSTCSRHLAEEQTCLETECYQAAAQTTGRKPAKRAGLPAFKLGSKSLLLCLIQSQLLRLVGHAGGGRRPLSGFTQCHPPQEQRGRTANPMWRAAL